MIPSRGWYGPAGPEDETACRMMEFVVQVSMPQPPAISARYMWYSPAAAAPGARSTEPPHEVVLPSQAGGG